MKTIQVESIKSNGHYSTATVVGNTMYISGQLPVVDGKVVDESVEKQVNFVLNKIETILNEVGKDKNCVAYCTVYISDIALWPEIDRCYAEFFKEHKPARVVVPCKELHFGSCLEVTAVADIS